MDGRASDDPGECEEAAEGGPGGGAPTRAFLNELLAAKAELEARNEALQLVNDLSQRFQKRLAVEAIAAETVDVLARHSQAPLVAFYLLEGEKGPLRMVTGRGFTEREMSLGALLPLEGSASGLAVRERRIVTIRRGNLDRRDLHPVVGALSERGLSTGFCIPLTHGERPLGTVNVIFPTEREISPLEIDTFHGIARAVSLAVANARLVADLEHLAFHDLPTGLPNRAGFHRRLLRLTAGGEWPARAGLVVVNLDRFREINDTLGHTVGDEILVEVVARLQARARARPADVFRLGGDEFAVVLPGAESLGEVAAEARLLLSELSQPLRVAGMGLEIGASAGVALLPEQGRDSHELLRCADVALHDAKRTPGGVAVYARELDQHTPERLALLSELGKGIRDGELVLHFQPTVALQYGFIEGFEALVRWRHPRLGLLLSGRFVPLAEATDLMRPLTGWVVKEALRQLAVWNREFPRLTMAINLSMRNILDRSFPDMLEEIVREAGVNPALLEYELTETAIMADPETAFTSLARITASGSRLAIDDFGTGYSSLSYLKRLPVDVLKIDQSFIADMATGPRSLAIVRSTVQLAHSLELGVVAEGVENRESARTLRAMGCDLAQGYYFARPAPAEEAAHHLARGGWLDVPV
ncbi:MAG: GGDEF domain-containing protein [Holophagales bacterium]|nr:GGDEF domain-containing protein [Holophagales bacterium]